jgi:hypothetical protein
MEAAASNGVSSTFLGSVSGSGSSVGVPFFVILSLMPLESVSRETILKASALTLNE